MFNHTFEGRKNR